MRSDTGAIGSRGRGHRFTNAPDVGALAIAVVVVLSALIVGVAASGTVGASHSSGTIVVDDDGGADATNTTIQGAIDHADPGDVIEVRAGTYDGFVLDRSGVEVVANGSVTIVGPVEVTADDTRIAGLVWDGFGASPILNVTGDGTVIEGIEMIDVPGASPRSTSIEIRGDDTVVRDSVFSRQGDESHAFIALFNGANTLVSTEAPTGTEILNNTLTGGDVGVFLEAGQTVTIRDNTIVPAASDDDAIWVTGPGYTPLDPTATLAIQDNGQLVEVDNRSNGGTVHYMTSLGNAFESSQSPVDDGATIRLGPGTFPGSDVTIDRAVTIDGVGMDETVVDARNSTQGGTQHAFIVRSDNVTIRDLTMTDGHNTIRISSQASVSDFSLLNARINDSDVGLYVSGANQADNGEFDRVVFRNTRWIDNERKGMYIEKLSNALIEDTVVDGVTSSSYGFNNGIDINLKHDDYTNVTIRDTVVANVAKGSPHTGVDSFSTAIAIKARDDAGHPNYGAGSGTPATLDGVTLDNVTVRDSSNGLRFGEPGSENHQPTGVVVKNSRFENNEGYHVSVETESITPDGIAPDGVEANTVDRGAFATNGSGAIRGQIWSTLQAAIDDARAGDTVLATGTFEESIAVDEPLTIAGEGDLVVDGSSLSGAGNGVEISASDVTLVDLNVTGFDSGHGIYVVDDSETVDNLALERVSSTLNDRGLVVGPTTTLTNLSVDDSHFDGNSKEGIYFFKELGEDDSTVDGVHITDTTLNQNGEKGLYAEKLENALLENLEVVGSGVDSDYPTNPDALNGIDINLKDGEYENVGVENSTFEATGLVGDNPDWSGALVIKARDDGSYAGTPANLTGVVVANNTFTSTSEDEEVALRFGESGADNFGPTGVAVEDNEFSGYERPVWDATTDSGIDFDHVLTANTYQSDDPVVFETSAGRIVFPSLQDARDTLSGSDVTYARNLETDELIVEDGMSIQAAVDAANPGETIRVADGTYELDSRLDGFSEDVTLVGESEAGVVIDGSRLAGHDDQWNGAWTVYVPEGAHGVTIQRFTVVNAPHDAVKANFVDDLTISNVTVVGADLSEMDLNNVRDATVSDVTLSGDDTEGVGLALSGVENVTVDGIETSGNRWGGVGIFNTVPSQTGGAPDGWTFIQEPRNVTIEGGSFDELVDAYTERGFGHDVDPSGLHGPTFDHRVRAPSYRSGNHTFYAADRADAVAVATAGQINGFDVGDGATVEYVDTGVFTVGEGMSLQAAVDAAEDGDTLVLQNGTHVQGSTLSVARDNLTISGESRDGVVVDTSAVPGYGIATEEGGNVVGLTVENLTVVGPQQGGNANYAFKINPTTTDVAIRNVDVVDSHRTGLDFNGVEGVLLEDVTVSGTTAGNGIALADTRDVLVDGATVEDNAWGGIALYTNDDAPERGTHGVTVVNSTISNNSGPGVYAQNSNEIDDPFEDVDVSNNEFRGNDVHVAEIDTDNALRTSVDWFDFDALVVANDFDRVTAVHDGDAVTVPAVFSTVQDAVDAASDGDTVRVGPGTYRGSIDVTGATDLSIRATGEGDVLLVPTETVGWNVNGYGEGRQTAVRVVDSEDVSFEGLAFDFGLVKDRQPFAGVLYWDSSGELRDNELGNTSTDGYYELTTYVSAPNASATDRKEIIVANNTYVNTGRQGLATHTYVNATVIDNEFHSADDDFGYAIEMGSESVGAIVDNEVHGYADPAASDGSQSAGIYVENAFTAGSPALTKDVLIADNDVYDNQYGVWIGQTWDGLSGPVRIDAAFVDNHVHDNTDAGIAVVDENAEQGSSVSVDATENVVERNGRVGYYVFTRAEGSSHVGDGNITLTVDGDTVTGHDTGVLIEDGGDPGDSTIDVEIHNSSLADNDVGVNNTWSEEVDASLNYWGASTGPGGAGSSVSGDVTYRPFFTNAEMTEDSTEPPTITDATLTDADGDTGGTVGNGDTVRVSANVSDVSGVASVTVDARPFGGPENLVLTDDDGDGVYDGDFAVIAAEANVDDDWSLAVTATDLGGSSANESTNALTLSTDSETRTSFTVSDANPLNTEVVDVAVTVRNVGSRSADRTITLIVDGADVRSRDVTVLPGQNRTVTFQHRFTRGTHTVTVNDSVSTLTGTTVYVARATNPHADVEITSPNVGDAFATDAVTVAYTLTDAGEGIAAVNYSVDGSPARGITDLNRSEVALTGLGEGQHTVALTLVDNLGNELSSDSVAFAVDSTEPVVTVDPARTGAIGSNRSAAIDLSVADDTLDSATFVVRDGTSDVYTEDVTDELADGSETTEWDGTDDVGDPLASGEYDLVLNATDEGGNTNESAVGVAVDSDPPSVDAVTPNATSLGGGDTLAVHVTASDASSGVENVTVTLAGVGVNFRTTAAAENQSGTWVATFDPDALPVDGNYTVRATATDAANNPGTGTAADEVAVDTTAPTVSAIIDTDGASTGYVNVTVSEDVSGAPAVTLNDSSGPVTVNVLTEVEPNRYSGTFSIGSGGNYTLVASATDEAGNSGVSTANSTISALPSATRHTIRGADGTVIVLNMTTGTAGTTAFTTSETPLAELGTNVGSTFLNGELSDDLYANLENATIRIPVQGNVPPGVDEQDVAIRRYNTTSRTWESVGPTDVRTIGGTEYFVVTVDTFSTYGPVAPDNVAPSIDASSPPSGTTYGYATSTVDVTVEYSDNKQVDAAAVTVEYDGTDVTGDAATSVSTTEATYTASNLVGSGQHWVNVTVVDTAGNEEYENVSFFVTEDTAAPSVTLEENTFDYGTDPVPLTFAYSDALSGVDTSSVQFRVDGTDRTGPATVTASGVEYDATSFGPGTYPVTLNVSDDEGHWANVSETFTVAGDTDDPTVSGRTFSPALSNGALPAGTTQATVTVEYDDVTSGVNTSAVEVRFDDGTGATDVTDEAVITGTGLTYTAVGLENGSSYTLEADVVDNEGNDVTETVTFEVASPSSGSGDTDGSTDSPSRDRPSVERVSASLQDGRGSIDLAGSVSRVEFDFGDGPASGSVTVQSLAAKPDSVPDIPGVSGIAYVDVTVPSSLTNTEATLRFTVDADAVGDAAPSTLVVYHYKDGTWTALETHVVTTSDGEIVLEATTPGFSLFAVGSAQQQATPGEESPTPDGETTTGPGEETPTPEDDATPTSEVSVEEPAGFSAVAILVVLALAIVVAALFVLARRRA